MVGKREHVQSSRAPWFLLGVATFSQIGMSFAQQGVAVLAVFIRRSFHLTLAEMGLLVSAMSLGVVTGQVLSGLVIDRRGPRWVLFWSTLGAVVLACLLRFAASFASWLVGLGLLGVALAGVPSSGTRAIFGAFHQRLRGLVMGIRQTGVPVGSALAAALLPILAAALGPNRVWPLVAALLAVSGVLFVWAMPRWRPAGRSDGSGSLSGMWGPLLLAPIMVSGQYSALTFIIPDLHAREGWSLGAAGLALAVIQIGGGMGRIAMGWWSDRIRRRGPVIAGLAVLASAMTFVVAFMPGGTPPLVILPVLWLLGVGAVGWNGLSLTWAGERVGSGRAGQAMSWTGSAAFLGSAVYPPVFGLVVDRTHEYAEAWALLGVWLFGGALVAALLSVAERRGRIPEARP